MTGYWVGLRTFLEVLGGAKAPPESLRRRAWFHVAWGVWWAALFFAVLAFSGRSTKFVYIDF
ncbi:MAG: hypothetical protein U0835_19425 [Isosphaeraceae bacterium]